MDYKILKTNIEDLLLIGQTIVDSYGKTLRFSGEEQVSRANSALAIITEAGKEKDFPAAILRDASDGLKKALSGGLTPGAGFYRAFEYLVSSCFRRYSEGLMDGQVKTEEFTPLAQRVKELHWTANERIGKNSLANLERLAAGRIT